MCTPEEDLMNLHDLELKKIFIECFKERFVSECDAKLRMIEDRIKSKKEELQNKIHIHDFYGTLVGACSCGMRRIKFNDLYFYTLKGEE